MNLFGWEISRKTATLSLDELIRRLESVYATTSGVAITPENCMESPTVHAIVTTITRHFASFPLHVYRKTTSGRRTSKEPLPNHSVERLLREPNDWQSQTDYLQDAISYFVRYGRFFAFKGRGVTGPIQFLRPINPSEVTVKQDEKWNVTYHVAQPRGENKPFTSREIHYVRGPARDGLTANSPVMDCREAIAAEIAAQKFGSAFFGNGAMPGMIFKFAEERRGFKSDEERNAFVEDFQAAYNKAGRFRAMLVPKGIEIGTPVGVEPEKAQFVQTRIFLRNVIAGAFGVPPYIVGDLERQTFNNAEQQSINKVTDLSLPIARIFESAMERDLLTTEDRNSGVIIRFNLDGALRGDFKTRQEGLKIQRENGVINPNEWREMENMNPRIDPGGEEYWDEGPSGQNADRDREEEAVNA